MNYITVTIREARDNFSELVERAALADEAFLVTKFGKPKALIISSAMVTQKKDEKKEILEKTAGLWVKRKDIKDSARWVKKLREKESSRYEKVFG